VRVLTLYSGSLSVEDGPAPTYIDFMRFNTQTIIDGLTG
jgi:ABC-type Zn uptake system ZnuABC Zn-binding protein ZnuA